MMKNPAVLSNKMNNKEAGFQIDSIWDNKAPKYFVACNLIHVTKATRYIGYTQIVLIGLFVTTVLLTQAQNVKLGEDVMGLSEGVDYHSTQYISSFVTALSLQLGLVLLMLHGVRSGRRSFLLPFMAFAAIALFLAAIQLFVDIIMLQDLASSFNSMQLFVHAFGILVHTWCMMTVFKCYSFFGDRNVAVRIGERLQETSSAFTINFARPPPYSPLYSDKQPLNA